MAPYFSLSQEKFHDLFENASALCLKEVLKEMEDAKKGEFHPYIRHLQLSYEQNMREIQRFILNMPCLYGIARKDKEEDEEASYENLIEFLKELEGDKIPTNWVEFLELCDRYVRVILLDKSFPWKKDTEKDLGVREFYPVRDQNFPKINHVTNGISEHKMGLPDKSEIVSCTVFEFEDYWEYSRE